MMGLRIVEEPKSVFRHNLYLEMICLGHELGHYNIEITHNEFVIHVSYRPVPPIAASIADAVLTRNRG